MKKSRMSYVAGVLWVLCFYTSASADPHKALIGLWSNLPRPQLCLAPCSKPPVIDGKLNDAAWRGASVATNFIRTRGTLRKKIAGLDAADAASEIRVTYDATHLYIAARMSEPNMEYLVSTAQNRDDAAWKDDCLEWFFDTNKKGDEIIQIIVNWAGVIWDGHDWKRKQDVSWTCEGLRAATGRGENEWYLEIAIPYEGLGVPTPQHGEVWRTSFNRQRYATPTGKRREVSAWVGQPEYPFKTPSRFGQLRFDELALTEANMPHAYFGVLKTQLAFWNSSSKPMKLTLVPMSTSSENRGEVQSVILAAGEHQKIVVPMLVRAEGTHVNAIAVYRGSDLMAVVRRSYHIPALTEQIQARLAYARILVEAQSQSETFRQNMATQVKVLEVILDEMNDLKKRFYQDFAEQAAMKESWSQLATRFEKVNVPKPPAKPLKSIWR